MTPQQIIEEIHKLPLAQQREIRDSFNGTETNPTMTEDEFEQFLLAEGIISSVPLRLPDDEEETYEPIEVEGEPLSEMILRERR